MDSGIGVSKVNVIVHQTRNSPTVTLMYRMVGFSILNYNIIYVIVCKYGKVKIKLIRIIHANLILWLYDIWTIPIYII